MITQIQLTDRNFAWFDIEEPSEQDFDAIAEQFGLPPLLVQDTLKPEHLPKYEDTEEGHFFMLRSFDIDCRPNEATTVQELTRKIALFVTDKRILSIHRVHLLFLDKISEKAKKGEAPKTIQGLVHQIILACVRTYEGPVNSLMELYDDFESDVLSKKNKRLATVRIYHFRRQLFIYKRLLKQINDALIRSKDFWEEQPSLLQDLKENIDQIYFQLDEISANFEHLFQLYIALNDQRANEVMKILTVFSSILLPLNFIASFYGMNFEFIPGLHSVHALGWVVFSMLAIVIGAIWYFKKRGWFYTRD